MNTFLTAIRRLVLSSTPAMRAVYNRANGSNIKIEEILNSEPLLTQIFQASTRLKMSDVERLVAQLRKADPDQNTKATYDHIQTILLVEYASNKGIR
ncbi:hypothetical protein GCM10010873_05490 [Cypionkella aquatica]|uniref:Uncharacterized protein n=1 Tax=Cypionkella aquatica TaxID=1756042 RepID=A0AA37TZ14_9RHOB|nr:hypothetical protein [Cypionkella aquatica]GLS85576.1 hypothetical protein GCM10010873_05490 [Cypionkella aquatica]